MSRGGCAADAAWSRRESLADAVVCAVTDEPAAAECFSASFSKWPAPCVAGCFARASTAGFGVLGRTSIALAFCAGVSVCNGSCGVAKKTRNETARAANSAPIPAT
jgi:hypothetical protein